MRPKGLWPLLKCLKGRAAQHRRVDFARNQQAVGGLRLLPPAPGLEFAVPAVLMPVIARITGRVDRLDMANQSAESVLASSRPSGTRRPNYA